MVDKNKPCWKGYKRVPGTKKHATGSCEKEETNRMKKEGTEMKEIDEAKTTKMTPNQVSALHQRYGYSKKNLPHLADRMTKVTGKKHTVKNDEIHVHEAHAPGDKFSKKDAMAYFKKEYGNKAGELVWNKGHWMDSEMGEVLPAKERVKPRGVKSYGYNEEVEQVDEISKEILQRYKKAANNDRRRALNKKDIAGNYTDMHGKTTHMSKWDHDDREAYISGGKRAKKRDKGIAMAQSKTARKGQAKVRATEEVEQVDELKKSTLASYTRKATSDAAMSAHNAGYMSGDNRKKAMDRANKRIKGVNRATTKLAKEDSDINEAGYKVPKNYAAMMAKKRKKAGTSEFGRHPDKKKEVKKEEVELDETSYLDAIQSAKKLVQRKKERQADGKRVALTTPERLAADRRRKERMKKEAVDPSDTGGAEEVSMAKKQIAAMHHYLDGIEASVKAKGDMEEWYQNKLTKANETLKTLYGYSKGDNVAEEVEQVDEADLRKMDHDTFMKYGDNNPKGRADPKWNAERKRRYKNDQAKNYRKMNKEEVEQVDESMLVSVRMYDDKDERNSEKVLKPMLRSGAISVDDVSDKGVMFRVKDNNTLTKMKTNLRKIGMSAEIMKEEVEQVREGAVSAGSVRKEISKAGGKSIGQNDKEIYFTHKGKKHSVPHYKGYVSDKHYMPLQKKLGESTEAIEEASQKLVKYMQGKHGVDAIKKMTPAEFRAAQAKAKEEMKAGAGKKAPEPKVASKTSKGKVRTGSADPADKNLIMQMRKAADYGTGKHEIRVSPTRSVKVDSKIIKQALAKHDSLDKPADKRKFKIALIKALRSKG